MRSILFIRPGGIGDAVLLIPAILDLKEKYPQVAVTVLAERRNAAVFALSPAVDRVLLYDRPMELFRALSRSYDAVIDTEQWHRFSAVVARLANAPLSVGFATNERQRLFSHSVPYLHDTYERESFRSLLAPLVAPTAEDRVPFLHVSPAATRRARELLGATPPFAVVFPGASITERRWGAENFRRLLEGMRARGIPAVVVGGRCDEAEGEEITGGTTALQLAGKTTLAETAAIIARSALLVSGDSGILHLGVGLGIPTVSLFGPGIAAKWAPRGEGDVVIDKRVSCSPCTRFGTTPRCRHGAKCIQEITVAEVLQGVEQLWQVHGVE